MGGSGLARDCAIEKRWRDTAIQGAGARSVQSSRSGLEVLVARDSALKWPGYFQMSPSGQEREGGNLSLRDAREDNRCASGDSGVFPCVVFGVALDPKANLGCRWNIFAEVLGARLKRWMPPSRFGLLRRKEGYRPIDSMDREVL